MRRHQPRLLHRRDHERLVVAVIAAVEPQMQGVLCSLEQHRLVEIGPKAACQRVALPIELPFPVGRHFGADKSVQRELAAI